jgi:molybdate transport system substrate-binding protein
VVAASKNPDAAKFMAFMSGPQAAAIFRKYGFTVLPRR